MDPATRTVIINLSILFAIVAVLQCLVVVLCREWVKNELRRNINRPIRIRWIPFAFPFVCCHFRVDYLDIRGYRHRGHCLTPWLIPRIHWIYDEVVGHEPESDLLKGE